MSRFKIIYDRDRVLAIFKENPEIILKKDEYLFEGSLKEAINFFKTLDVDCKILQRLKNNI